MRHLSSEEIDRYLDTPEDDEYHELIDMAYQIADARYVKNEGQAFYEELLCRGLIGLMRDRRR